MISNDFNFQIIHLSTVDSTNIYALELLQKKNVQEGQVIWADFQEKGKGQLHSKWKSDAYKNLTFSLILKPDCGLESGFDISKLVVVAIIKYLDTLTAGEIQIKWPNDILINKQKVAGILIENSIQRNRIASSVIGIGLNINQVAFPEFNRRASSLKLETGRTLVPEEILHGILQSIKKEYLEYKEKGFESEQYYLNRLYGLGEAMNFKDESGYFTGVIMGVSPSGHLLLNKNGKLRSYENKEIEFRN